MSSHSGRYNNQILRPADFTNLVETDALAKLTGEQERLKQELEGDQQAQRQDGPRQKM